MSRCYPRVSSNPSLTKKDDVEWLRKPGNTRAGNELSENSGWYETFFRGYDAALGRFMQVDPLASLYNSHSPYHFAYNNPVMFNDPFGAEADSTGRDSGSGPPPIPRYFDTQRFGPGSGNYWSDGSKYSDWSANGGSQMYRDGLAAGLVDIGGTLYDISDGYRTPASEHNGQLGMYYDSYTDWYVNGEYVDSYYSYTYFKPFGDPNIQSFVNPLSFDLSNVFGRYVSYVNYNEIYADIFDPANLKTYDQLNIRLDRIALSVRAKVAYDDPNVIFMLARAFDEARFKVFDEFDQRSIFNMMTDTEGEKKFMTYLNESLQNYFPSTTTFAKVGYELISAGEPPTSTITFIGPYYSPN